MERKVEAGKVWSCKQPDRPKANPKGAQNASGARFRASKYRPLSCLKDPITEKWGRICKKGLQGLSGLQGSAYKMELLGHDFSLV